MDASHGSAGCDFYRVNFEVNNLKPFPYLAFPHLIGPGNTPKMASFDGKLMASFETSNPNVR
jgi:hypothetical protein